MLYDGKAIQIEMIDDIAHFTFDIKDSGANVIGALATAELSEALEIIKGSDAKGVLYKSNKEHFIFGADITEFMGHFAKTHEELKQWILDTHELFNGYEDLGIPTVVAINGFALGGGLEFCLTADYRVMDAKAKIGLPETRLGIMPGWGGSVRLPRMCGADHAIEWITSGKHYKAADALKIGAVDAVVELSLIHI